MHKYTRTYTHASTCTVFHHHHQHTHQYPNPPSTLLRQQLAHAQQQLQASNTALKETITQYTTLAKAHAAAQQALDQSKVCRVVGWGAWGGVCWVGWMGVCVLGGVYMLVPCMGVSIHKFVHEYTQWHTHTPMHPYHVYTSTCTNTHPHTPLYTHPPKTTKAAVDGVKTQGEDALATAQRRHTQQLRRLKAAAQQQLEQTTESLRQQVQEATVLVVCTCVECLCRVLV